MEITEMLQVPKEEWKEERDIETLLVPKEECEVEDIEFTWPVYLVEYLSTQGFSSHLGQNISHLKLLNGEYYTILPSTKLTILQFLCDDIMEAGSSNRNQHAGKH